jgi:hypothetical protein
VRWKWYFTRSAAKRAAGRVVHVSEAAELIAAEVLSALPIAEGAEEDACEETGVSWSGESIEPQPSGAELCETGSVRGNGVSAAQAAPRPPWRSARAEGSCLPPTLGLPPALASLLEGIEDADAFTLDERFRRALSLEQRLEARIGPLLAVVWDRFLHRALGYRSREAYARERLAMDPTRARALVRLERAALLNEAFARAYRAGALSWVKADVLAPLVSGELLGSFSEQWVAWAERITVRRLRDDVEHALALRETDPQAFHRAGGLPPEARGGRGIGAPAMGGRGDVVVGEVADRLALGSREIGAPAMEFPLGNRHPEPLKSAPDEICWVSFSGPADVVQLLKAVLSTVRQGSDALENRITLCAFHHLRGVHAGLLRCVGRAPDGLRWELGIRPGVTPLAVYRSGDLRVKRMVSRPFPA